ncbi:RNA polymerase sigma factor [Longispora albida]|uniref:RNA polymerase sigma factor n=1 Tax=Longispora albida TaxID=203523 RepID=UPI00037870DC|nr:sigma-70 family RNA polymerase sigma factor [Longispora albida]
MRDSSSFDEFHSATTRRLTHYLYALTGDLAEAQDITQEVYLRAWRRWSQLQGYDNPEAWIRLVGTRLAVSGFRKATRFTRAMLLFRRPEAVPEPSEDSVLLTAALRRLPDAQRVAIVQHHLLGMRIEDIAAEAGVSPGTIKSRLSRGRAALANLIDISETGEPGTPEVAHAL